MPNMNPNYAPKPKVKTIVAAKTKVRPKPAKSMTPEDAAYDKLMKKYGYDVTKIPGWNGGKGTR